MNQVTTDLSIGDVIVPLSHHGALHSHSVPLGRIGSSQHGDNSNASITGREVTQNGVSHPLPPGHSNINMPWSGQEIRQNGEGERPLSGQSASSHRGHTGHMNFSNLILADIERTLSRQSDRVDSGQKQTTGSGGSTSSVRGQGHSDRVNGTGSDSGNSETGNTGYIRNRRNSIGRTATNNGYSGTNGRDSGSIQNNSDSREGSASNSVGEGGINLSIGSLTQEAEQIVERKRRMKKVRAQPASLVQHRKGGNSENQSHGGMGNLDISGVACER